MGSESNELINGPYLSARQCQASASPRIMTVVTVEVLPFESAPQVIGSGAVVESSDDWEQKRI